MKSSRFREMSGEELVREQSEISQQLFKLRFQIATGQAEDPSKLRSARRDLARVKTRLRELEIEAEAGASSGSKQKEER